MKSLTRSRNLLLVLIIIYWVIGCNEKKDVPQTEVTLSPFHMEDLLGQVMRIHVIDSIVIFHNKIDTTLLSAFKDDNSGLYRNFGLVGRSNETILSVGTIYSADSSVYIYDIYGKKILELPLDSIFTKSHLTTVSHLEADVPILLDLIPLNNHEFIGVSIAPDYPFYILNKQGKIIRKGGFYPTNARNQDILVHAVASQSHITKHPTKPLIATGANYGRILQIYEITQDEILRKSLFEPEFLEYTIVNDRQFYPNEKTKWGYLSLTADEKYIYALYSGKIQFEDKNPYMGNRIHVFDWNGNLCFEYKLDKEVTRISLDNGFIYGIYMGDRGYDIFKFDVKCLAFFFD